MNGSHRTNRTRSTLSDVAQMAGVSESTVSLVLAGKAARRRISVDTHEKVRQAALVLGYTPSLLHRSMRRGRTHVISLYNAFRNRDRDDLYMNRLSSAIGYAGGNLGYDVLVHSNFQRDTKETYEFLNGGLSDGLVLFGPSLDEPLLPLLRDSNLPVVVIGPRREDIVLSTVLDDEGQGMKLVAQALLDHGHCHVAAVVDSVGGMLDPTGRLRRLQSDLGDHAIPMSQEAIFTWNGHPDEIIDRLLALSPRPTALFVWHDRVAYRMVEALQSRGLRIPHDLSVVGYDGLIWPSTSPHVVTSVKVPLDDMAEAAVAMLHRLIEGEKGPLSHTLPVQFLTGTTLGPNGSSQ